MRSSLRPDEIEAFRKRLTEVATHLYLEKGLDALSLRSLATEAEISRSTPYGYFKNKQEIIDAIRAASLDRLTEACAQGIEAETSALAKMRRLGLEVVRFACAEPAIYQLIFSRPVFEGDVGSTLSAAVSHFREVSRPPLEEAVRQGLVRGDPAVLRRVTWAAFHGLIQLHLQGHFEATTQLMADFEALNQVIGFGILVPPSPQGAQS
jgi:AcrR family transcriptional regulator